MSCFAKFNHVCYIIYINDVISCIDILIVDGSLVDDYECKMNIVTGSCI